MLKFVVSFSKNSKYFLNPQSSIWFFDACFDDIVWFLPQIHKKYTIFKSRNHQNQCNPWSTLFTSDFSNLISNGIDFKHHLKSSVCNLGFCIAFTSSKKKTHLCFVSTVNTILISNYYYYNYYSTTSMYIRHL